MAEPQIAVASAVIIPEIADQPPSPQTSAKRRQSSAAENPDKRPRLEDPERSHESKLTSDAATDDKSSERRRSGHMEERKRGQRLFGALLGTLSQSSSSAAHKRRIDIEKKQQAKLKLQDEEYDDEKKQKLEALMEIRRWEQKKYKKQSMQIRHSNLLTMAQFLRTEAQPQLYYKPWEMLPSDEEKIASQLKEAEAIIENETASFQADEPTEETGTTAVKVVDSAPEAPNGGEGPETVGPVANQAELVDPLTSPHANSKSPSAVNMIETTTNSHDTSKDHADDGGEVVLEADEDTVIY